MESIHLTSKHLLNEIGAKPAPLVITSLFVVATGLASFQFIERNWLRVTLLTGAGILSASWLYLAYSLHTPRQEEIKVKPAPVTNPPSKLVSRAAAFGQILGNSNLNQQTVADLRRCYINQETDLSLSGIDQIPDYVFQFAWLEKLYIRHSTFEIVSPEISNLKKLTFLQMDYGNLKSLPAEIGLLTELVTVRLTSNKSLSTLPKEIENLKKLGSLEIGQCNISELSFDLNELPSLRKLTLADNPIEKLPTLRQGLPLQDLDISRTKIGSIDFLEGIDDITVTHSANIQYGNQIRSKLSYSGSRFQLKEDYSGKKAEIYDKNGNPIAELTEKERASLNQWDFNELNKTTDCEPAKKIYAFFDLLKSKQTLYWAAKTSGVSPRNAAQYVAGLRDSGYRNDFDFSKFFPESIPIGNE
jgi:Leucine-rich repeat (LRR) protein